MTGSLTKSEASQLGPQIYLTLLFNIRLTAFYVGSFDFTAESLGLLFCDQGLATLLGTVRHWDAADRATCTGSVSDSLQLCVRYHYPSLTDSDTKEEA